MRPPAIRFDAPRRSWRRAWLIALAALVALAALCLVLQDWGALEPAAAPPAALSVAVIVAPSEVPAPTAARPSEPLLLAAGDAGQAELEICGGAWVGLDANGEVENLDALLDRLKRGVRERTLAALVAAADEPSRAGGLFLGSSAALDDALDDALARLAQTTRDARVYALAFHACGATQMRRGACQLLSAAQWARLDPDNAVPWLYAAEAAEAQSDAAGLGEAMYRVSQARHIDSSAGTLPLLVLEHAPANDAALPGTVELLADVLRAQAAFVPPYPSVLRYCGATALRDSNRWQTCAGIAEVLAARSDALADRKVGAAIGQQVGWTSGRLAALQAEQRAARRIAAAAFDRRDAPLDCGAARRTLAYIGEAARYGELGALRRAAARAGTTVAQLAGTGTTDPQAAETGAIDPQMAEAGAADPPLVSRYSADPPPVR